MLSMTRALTELSIDRGAHQRRFGLDGRLVSIVLPVFSEIEAVEGGNVDTRPAPLYPARRRVNGASAGRLMA